MTELKLRKIPDRTPVKIIIYVPPDLRHDLLDYATLYGQIYGKEESITELPPVMLHAFMKSDRRFIKWKLAMRRS